MLFLLIDPRNMLTVTTRKDQDENHILLFLINDSVSACDLDVGDTTTIADTDDDMFHV